MASAVLDLSGNWFSQFNGHCGSTLSTYQTSTKPCNATLINHFFGRFWGRRYPKTDFSELVGPNYRQFGRYTDQSHFIFHIMHAPFPNCRRASMSAVVENKVQISDFLTPRPLQKLGKMWAKCMSHDSSSSKCPTCEKGSNDTGLQLARGRCAGWEIQHIFPAPLSGSNF